MRRAYSKTERMPNEEPQGESRVRENRTHGLVDEGKPTTRRRRMGGFSLIELLVVIAIIAILASLLLPSLKKAFDMAKRTSCQNTLKQMTFSFTSYSDDSNDYFVPYYDGTYIWTHILVLGNYVPTGKMFMCPSLESYQNGSWEKITPANPWPDGNHAFPYKHPAYGYNFLHIGGSQRWWYPESDYTPAKRGQVHKPSDTILMADDVYTADPPWGGWYELYDASGGTTGVLHPRHASLSLNVVWTDGHITAVTAPNALDPYVCSPFRNGSVQNDPDNHWQR